MKRLLLIMNPNAGQKNGKRYLADILEIFRRADYMPTAFMTVGTGDAFTLAKEHAADAQLVVCVGGDGTFNEVTAGVVESGVDVPIGYIPCGSTNDFATSLKLSKNILQAARDIVDGTPKTYDIGQFGKRYFSYVASFGAFTRASYATPQNLKNALGHLAYILEGIKDLPNIRPIHMRIETADRVFEDDYIFGAICNSTSLGGVLTLSPDAVNMNDGLFELLLIKYPYTAAELNDCIRCLQEKKYDSPTITLHSTDRLTIHCSTAVDWTLDGEYECGHALVEAVNRHNAFRLITNQ
ncbi:MAG: YegS/Rv2252/BmrU family lipid kinase [Clostridia bacterium]|nr:YegS/Rv2252/BmrU family lipid kinase [Clostridia bacterium]